MPTSTLGPIVVFGDSLSDPGNLFGLTDGIVADTIRASFGGGPSGEIGDGPVWSETIGTFDGVEIVGNYAVAGAEAVGTQKLGDFLLETLSPDDLLVPVDASSLDYDMNLAAQIDRFLSDFVGQDISDLTAVIQIGSNDLLNIDLTGRPGAILASAMAVFDALYDALHGVLYGPLGDSVGQIVIVTMPPLDFFPAFAGQSAYLLDVATDLMADLYDRLEADSLALAEVGVDVAIVEIDDLTNALMDDPSSFGLIAPTTLTLTGGSPDLAPYDADQVMFWDDLHPTTATQDVIAVWTEAALSGDTVALTDADDVATLMSGDDGGLVFAYGGSDRVTGGDAADTLFGGSGDDRLLSRGGKDLVSGGSGDDLIVARGGGDVIDGGQGDDLVLGNTGRDVILDGTGSDWCIGGAGDDTFIWIEETLVGGSGGSTDWLSGGDGQDIVYVVLSADSFAVYAEAIEGAGLDAALQALGLVVAGMEDIVVLEERAAIDVLSDQAWYADADLWGLV